VSLVRSIAVALVLVTTCRLTYAQATDLERLARDLHLTAPGTRGWLEALGVVPRQPVSEHLLAVTLDGRIVATRDGTEAHVTLGPDLDRRLLTPGARLVLIHNHPRSLGFSADDLVLLAKPGVAAVVAIGHDGSVYVASAARQYDSDFFEPNQYGTARTCVQTAVRDALASHVVSKENVETYFAHLVSLTLARAGVIGYYAALAPDRRSGFETAQVVYARIVVLAASRLVR
jgi:hypothetical protein